MHCPYSFAGCLTAGLIALGPFNQAAASDASNDQNPVNYVRPLIGTQGAGNTFPGASAPFGMVQCSPDTDREACSGYKYRDDSILGFSLTHLSGTGIADLGDFLFTPIVGSPKFVPGTPKNPESGYRVRFAHADEHAEAGYYRVKLKNSVTAELTAAKRVAVMRFTFLETEQASILTDLDHFLWPDWRKKRGVVGSQVKLEDKQTITGGHRTSGWTLDRQLYFAARYSRPFDSFQILSNGVPLTGSLEAAGTNLQFLAQYKTTQGEVILVKAAVSAISEANALENLKAEMPDWDFEKVRSQTRDQWSHELSKIQIEGTVAEKEVFYTALYHAFLSPNLYQDANCQYRGLDQQAHQANGFINYTTFSLWDTYRAVHPLFTLIQSERDANMINSMLAHYDQSPNHMLPVWSLQACETRCMIGYHAVPVIVDAYFKGVKGFDPDRAFAAVKTTALNQEYTGLADYIKLGWVPCDKCGESVSKTLEYAYDDYCIARLAKALGKAGDYDYFIKRSRNFANVFDPIFGLMRGKDSQGQWHEPFDPHLRTTGPKGDYTEATAWQYSWYAPQDMTALIALMGGRGRFTAKLDSLFSFGNGDPKESLARKGNLGEYAHGNEPSHHIIYLYCYAGKPSEAAKRLHQVVENQYGNKPGSLCGNDDCGQMSAWYIFTVMGFYPICPASDYYVLGSPAVKQAVMHLSNDSTFTMTAHNLSQANIYIQSARLNGKNWNSPFLPYREIANGGTLDLVMGPQPSAWGTNPTIPDN